MEIMRDKETGSDNIFLSAEESAKLMLILNQSYKIDGLEKEYLDFAKVLESKLWNE